MHAPGAMMWCCVLGCWLTVGTQALIAPAPIRWAGLKAKNFVIAPKSFMSRTLVPSPKLAIWERPGTAPQEVSYFTANRDGTISLGSGRCVEASGNQTGADIHIRDCTGRPTQLWSVMPGHREQTSQIQLKGSTKCIGVNDNERDMNGALLELQECGERASELWTFEDPVFRTQIPSHHATSFSVRHALICCASMMSLGVFSLGVWLRRCSGKARMRIARKTSTSLLVDQGGICLVEPVEPVILHQNQTERLAPSIVVQPSMLVGTDAPNIDGEGNRDSFATTVDMASTLDAIDSDDLAEESQLVNQGGSGLAKGCFVGALHKPGPSRRLWSVPEIGVEASADFGTSTVPRSFQNFFVKYLKTAIRDCRHCHQALCEHRVTSAFATVATMLAAVLVTPIQASAAELTSTVSTNDFRTIAYQSLLKALHGGKAGAVASLAQLFALQWMHTAMLYQHRFGGSLKEAIQALLKDGGIRSLYRGVSLTVFLLPMTRFGMTAANIGTLAFFDALPTGVRVPMPIKSAIATVIGVAWKLLFCLPIETAKVTVQVHGSNGFARLKKRIRAKGLGVLYKGIFVAAVGGVLNIFPFLITYNFFNSILPVPLAEKKLRSLLRSAFVGIAAQCASSTASNSCKVIKTNQQVEGVTAREALALVLEADGIKGLFGRGLQTRLLNSAIQGGLFNVLWVYLLRE